MIASSETETVFASCSRNCSEFKRLLVERVNLRFVIGLRRDSNAPEGFPILVTERGVIDGNQRNTLGGRQGSVHEGCIAILPRIENESLSNIVNAIYHINSDETQTWRLAPESSEF